MSPGLSLPSGGTEWRESAGVSISHPQVSWALIIAQHVRLWLTAFSGVRPCQENRVFCLISNWFLSPPPAGSMTGFFSYSLWEPGQAPEGKSHNIVGLSSCLGPLAFSALRLPHTEPPAICRLRLRFSYWPLSLCSKKPRLPVVTCLSLPSWGQGFSLCPPLSHRS